jgi:hypothetical protein
MTLDLNGTGRAHGDVSTQPAAGAISHPRSGKIERDRAERAGVFRRPQPASLLRRKYGFGVDGTSDVKEAAQWHIDSERDAAERDVRARCDTREASDGLPDCDPEPVCPCLLRNQWHTPSAHPAPPRDQGRHQGELPHRSWHHHDTAWVAYQPHSHLIWLELARNGILVTAASLAVLASVWWLRIRPAD